LQEFKIFVLLPAVVILLLQWEKEEEESSHHLLLHNSDVSILHHPSLGRSSSNPSKNGGKRRQLSRFCYGKRFDNFVENRKDARAHTIEFQF
jgi:hypothetical protein